MRITLVTDVYPPARMGGATIHAVDLAECLVGMGHQVDVLCAGTWDEGPAHINGLTEDRYHGVRLHRLHLNWRQAPAPFDHLYDNSDLAPLLRHLLQHCQPDLVHVNSLRTLSARVVVEAKRLGLPVVLHLHSFAMLCPMQNLVRKDGTRCEGPQLPWACQSCLLAGTKALRWSGAILPDRVQERLFTRAGRIRWLTRQPGLAGMLGDVPRRQTYLRDVVRSADLVLVPARFAIALFARHGFTTGHFVHAPLGLDLGWVGQVRREPSDRIRFGFTGHLQRIKGIHTLVDAFNRLPAHLPAELHIYGDPSQEPDYAAGLRLRAGPGIHWQGSYSRAQLPQVLGALDVVVVPSLCHELYPTVIREAFAAGIPVIVSDGQGPVEAVRDGVDGLHFRAGDLDDLRRVMVRCVVEEGLLARLRRRLPPVKTIEEDARDMLHLYGQLPSRSSPFPLPKALENVP